MSESHLINANDWADFVGLMQWWRARKRTDTQPINRERRDPPLPRRVVLLDDLHDTNEVDALILHKIDRARQCFDIAIFGHPFIDEAAENITQGTNQVPVELSKTFRLRFTLPDDNDPTTDPEEVETEEISCSASAGQLWDKLPIELAPWAPTTSLGTWKPNEEAAPQILARWRVQLLRPTLDDGSLGTWATPIPFEVGIGYLGEMRIKEQIYDVDHAAGTIKVTSSVPLPQPTPIPRGTCAFAVFEGDGFAVTSSEIRRFTPWAAPGTPIEPEDLPIETDPRTGL